MNNYISVLHLNVRSLFKHIDEILNTSDITSNDILCFSETWLNSSHPNHDILLPNFSLLRKDRGDDRRGGGLAIYIKNNIKFEALEIQCPLLAEFMGVKIFSGMSSCNVVAGYIPPNEAHNSPKILESLFECNRYLTSSKTIIIGDFNVDWAQNKPVKTKMVGVLEFYQFSQLMNSYTRVTSNSKTIIDLCFSNDALFCNPVVLELDISDHFAIKCNINLGKPVSVPNTTRKRDFRKFNESEFFNYAKYVNFYKASEISCAHQAADFLENVICNIVDQFAPYRLFKPKNVQIPWITKEIKYLAKQKRLLFRNYIKSGAQKMSSEWSIYKSCRNKLANIIKAAKRQSYEQKLTDSNLGVWDKINLFRHNNSKSNCTIDKLKVDDKVIMEPIEISKCLNEFFASVGTKLNNSFNNTNLNNNGDYTNQHHRTQTFSFHKVDKNAVMKHLMDMKGHKTGGIDQIPAFVYKILGPLIIAPLTYIINKSIETNIFPNKWKTALVIPIFKTGDTTQPGNYRPISLLPILGKVFEKILNIQIRAYIFGNNLLHSRQFGFRNGASTDQLVLQLITKFKLMLAHPSSNFITVAALDISKAFDCVNHEILSAKLTDLFGFDTSALNLVNSYLSNRAQRLKVNNVISQPAVVATGVPQGSILGPLLFILFINDLMEIRNTFLFADDCLLVSAGETAEKAAKSLEIDLIETSNWYTNNKLVLNAKKTDILTFSSLKTKQILPEVRFQSCAIKQSEKIKYLGFHLDSNLKMSIHVKTMKKKLYPNIGNFIRKRKYLNDQLAALWYKALIRPHLEYGAAVMFGTSTANIKELKKIESRCLKIINKDTGKDLTRVKHDITDIEIRLKYFYILAFYKIFNKLVPIIDHNIIPQRPNVTCTRLNSFNGAIIGRNCGTSSILNMGASIFNSLPAKVRSIKNFKSFKTALKSLLLHP